MKSKGWCWCCPTTSLLFTQTGVSPATIRVGAKSARSDPHHWRTHICKSSFLPRPTWSHNGCPFWLA
jgi:hypothetical protein